MRCCTPTTRHSSGPSGTESRIGKPGSGYILSSACSVAPHVKPERLKRLVELAEKHGRY